MGRSKVFTWHDRVDQEWSVSIDSNLPIPDQCAIPDELEEQSTRWHGNAVLLSWHGQSHSSADGGMPLELQARAEFEEHATHGWKKVSWSRVLLAGINYVAVMDLPFDMGRFRWVDAARCLTGRSSDICTAHLPPPTNISADIHCTRCAIRVRLMATFARQQLQRCHFFRIRFRRTSLDDETAFQWEVMSRLALDIDGKCCIDATLGAEDGLEEGMDYVFSVQVSSNMRRSQWSEESAVTTFGVPLVFHDLPTEAALAVQASTTTSVTFTWPELIAPQVLSPRSFSPAGSPQLACRLDLSQRLQNGGLQHRTSVLLEEGDDQSASPTRASVYHLQPNTEYQATLCVRFLRLGMRKWQSTGLTASFVTPPAETPKRR